VIDRYATSFRRLSDSRAAALIPYLVIGDPTSQRFTELVGVLVDNGADALELGIAFSDPLADGPTIQEAAARAIGSGMTPERSLDLVAQIRQRYPDLPIGLLVYANTVLNTPSFGAKCAAAEVDSVLIADAPLEESISLGDEAVSVRRVFVLPPNADDTLTKAIARASEGYVYVTSRAGVTGATESLSEGIGRHLPLLAESGAAPAVLGFGISTCAQIRAAVTVGFAGVIVGSAVVQRISDNLADSQRMAAEIGAMVADMKCATVQAGRQGEANQ
jgi:tryptophan synthase alpha chain